MSKPDSQSDSARTKDKRKADEVDESSLESFPASDAPTSWAGRDIPPDEREAIQKKNAAQKKKD